MTVGLELACCAGAGTVDASTTKNKGRTLTSLLFIRTSRFEELPNSPRLLRTMLPSYCPLGRACTVLWARLRIQSTHESRLIGSRGGPRKTVGHATEFSLSAKMILLIGSDKPEGCRKDPTGYYGLVLREVWHHVVDSEEGNGWGHCGDKKWILEDGPEAVN